MNDLKIITHFSVPRWPLVNKLSGIAKCLEVETIHCSDINTLAKTLSVTGEKRVLLVTDENMVDFVDLLQQKEHKFELEVALFIQSRITNVAAKISQLESIRYLLEFDENDSFAGRHLAILIKKVKERNYLDLDKYLGFGASLNSKSINSNFTKKAAIEEINRYIANLGDSKFASPYKEYARRITEMVDELVLNAIFNANPRMRELDRSEPFALGQFEEVHLNWGYDGEYFGVSVRDHFGQFSLESIMEHVSSVPTAAEIVNLKSAGIGQKLIFERAHQIVTNVKKRKITEVIAIVKFENRLLDFEKTKKSFFYFTDGSDKISAAIN